MRNCRQERLYLLLRHLFEVLFELIGVAFHPHNVSAHCSIHPFSFSILPCKQQQEWQFGAERAAEFRSQGRWCELRAMKQVSSQSAMRVWKNNHDDAFKIHSLADSTVSTRPEFGESDSREGTEFVASQRLKLLCSYSFRKVRTKTKCKWVEVYAEWHSLTL